MKTNAYAAQSPTAPLAPMKIDRREPGAKDVAIDILFCGVCHSDLHTTRGEWPGVLYPSVPGHEIVGRVSAVGGDVRKHKVGDIVGVGCMVDSCRVCNPCKHELEQYCASEHGMTLTYNGAMKGGMPNTYGGYSSHIVVDEHFVLSVKHKTERLAAVAPLLCAGITTWSPLRHWKAGPGKKVGIVGIGGLGHMGVKLARALGAHGVAFTTSPSKRQAAIDLGAHDVVVSTSDAEMAQQTNTLDFILNTVSASHNLDPFLNLLTLDGTMTLVGAPSQPHPSPNAFGLIMGRRSLAGSAIGGIAETQEMLDFCAKHDVVSDIEPIAMADINNAYERLVKGDVKYRFVIDMATMNA